MNGGDRRSQILVARLEGEAGGVNEKGVAVLVREAGNVEVDPYERKCVTRVSNARRTKFEH